MISWYFIISSPIFYPLISLLVLVPWLYWAPELRKMFLQNLTFYKHLICSAKLISMEFWFFLRGYGKSPPTPFLGVFIVTYLKLTSYGCFIYPEIVRLDQTWKKLFSSASQFLGLKNGCCHICPRDSCPRRPWSKGTNVQGTVVKGDFGPRRLLSKEAFTIDKLAQIIFFILYWMLRYWLIIKWQKNNMNSL